MRATKKITRDLGNGLLAFTASVHPADIPTAYALAPQQSALRVLASADGHSHLFHALKAPTVDNGDGSAGLVLHVSAVHAPSDLLYAHKGLSFELSVTLAPELDPGVFPVTPEERARLIKTLAIICQEAAFHDFIRNREDTEALLPLVDQNELDHERGIIEVVLRRIGAHSRSEIANNVLVAERAERLVRAYRGSRFSRDDSFLSQSPERLPDRAHQLSS